MEKVSVTVSLNKALVDEVNSRMVGQSSFTHDLETAIATGLRIMLGELGFANERYFKQVEALKEQGVEIDHVGRVIENPDAEGYPETDIPF